MRMIWIFVVALLVCASLASAAPVVSNLTAEYRGGQVFLTWDETADCKGWLNVYEAKAPITATTISNANLIAHHINPGSAWDWWTHPEAYGQAMKADPDTGKLPEVKRIGMRISAGAERLNPNGGLFVNTVSPAEVGERYYAVTSSDIAGDENREIIAGVNSLAMPVQQECAPVDPIWQSDSAPTDPTAGEGLPVHLILHGAGGRGGMEYMAFGDETLGWREGLSFKFGVSIRNGAVYVTPNDRTWIARKLEEHGSAWQKLMPVVSTWWYGYNSNIYDRATMREGIVTNYTERRLMWILDWVQRSFNTDPNRVYVYGSSMGGGGGISFALRHPERFAGIRANVPIVAYIDGEGGKAEYRFESLTGGMDMMCNEGMPVRDRLTAAKFIETAKGDLPLVVMTSGRTDPVSPWWANPPFFKAMQDNRQALIASWNNETHSYVDPNAPEDIRVWNDLSEFHHLSLNKSYVVFTNSSADGDYGTGPKDEGDLIGHINRGLSYEDPIDETSRYEVVIHAAEVAGELPITVDITPRRLQVFRPQPGQKVLATNTNIATGEVIQKQTITVESECLFTFIGYKLDNKDGNRLSFSTE